jgi:hypothetical protein
VSAFNRCAAAFLWQLSGKQWMNQCSQRRRIRWSPRLHFHDLRRTASRNLRRPGISEGVIMKIGGCRTRSVFERYAILSQTDIADALKRLEAS